MSSSSPSKSRSRSRSRSNGDRRGGERRWRDHDRRNRDRHKDLDREDRSRGRDRHRAPSRRSDHDSTHGRHRSGDSREYSRGRDHYRDRGRDHHRDNFRDSRDYLDDRGGDRGSVASGTRRKRSRDRISDKYQGGNSDRGRSRERRSGSSHEDTSHREFSCRGEDRRPEPEREPEPKRASEPPVDTLHQSPRASEDTEQKVWEDLREYLSERGLDTERLLKGWEIKIIQRGTYNSYLYQDPRGKTYESKGEVRRSFEPQGVDAEQYEPLSDHDETARLAAWLNSRSIVEKELGDNFQKYLGPKPTGPPLHKGEMFLVSLGKIDSRKGFCSRDRLWPPGYHCIKVAMDAIAGVAVRVDCKILEADGKPRFRLEAESADCSANRLKSGKKGGSPRVSEAGTETEAWEGLLEKLGVPPEQKGSAVLGGFPLSNSPIDRMLEGMDDAPACRAYSFFEHRSSASAFITRRTRDSTTVDDLKARLLAKWKSAMPAREKKAKAGERSWRQRAAVVAKRGGKGSSSRATASCRADMHESGAEGEEEPEAEAGGWEEEEERQNPSSRKRSSRRMDNNRGERTERGRRAGKEEDRKPSSRASRVRATTAKQDESKRVLSGGVNGVTMSQRGRTRKPTNFFSTYEHTEEEADNADALLPSVRKDVEHQLRANRKEARAAVLIKFDAESAGLVGLVQGRDDDELGGLDDPPPAPRSTAPHPGEVSGLKLEHMMELWCFLRTFSKPLGLRMTPTLKQLKGALLALSASPPPTSESPSPHADGEEEFREDTQADASAAAQERKEAQAMFDGICSSIVRLLLPDLHAALGAPCDNLSERALGAEPPSVQEILLVNQLTWPELARQLLILHMTKEHLNLTETEAVNWMRGGPKFWKTERAALYLLRQRVEYRRRREEAGDCAPPSHSAGATSQPPSPIKVKPTAQGGPAIRTEEEGSASVCAASGGEAFAAGQAGSSAEDVKPAYQDGPTPMDCDDGELAPSEACKPEPAETSALVPSTAIPNHAENAQPDGCAPVESKKISDPDQRESKAATNTLPAEEESEEESEEDEGIPVGPYEESLRLRDKLQRFILRTSNGAGKQCGLVLWEIWQHKLAVDFVFEPDSPEYFDVVARPTCLSKIALRLLKGEYGVDERLVTGFTAELRLLWENTCCFYSEGLEVFQSVLKLLQITERLLRERLGSAAPLDIQAFLQSSARPCSGCSTMDTDFAKVCDRCEAPYHGECVDAAEDNVAKGEWFCPHCVEEGPDLGCPGYGCASRIPKSVAPPLLSGSGLDGSLSLGTRHEGDVGLGGLTSWGPFPGVPKCLDWSLNATLLRILTEEGEARTLHDALRLLSCRDGGFLPSSQNSWTPSERATVLLALTILVLRCEPMHHFLADAEAKCSQLRQKALSGARINHGSFASMLRDVGGNRAVEYWHRLLADAEASGIGLKAGGVLEDEEDLGATPGVCVGCWRSTNDDEESSVLICDGCEGEVHFACSKLPEMPPDGEDFFCRNCERRRKRKSQRQQSECQSGKTEFEEVEELMKVRLRSEHDLKARNVENVLQIRLKKRQPQGRGKAEKVTRCGTCSGCKGRNCQQCRVCKDNPRFGGPGKIKGEVCLKRKCRRAGQGEKVELDEGHPYSSSLCEYCGRSEEALCSRLVVGQTRGETEAYLTMHAKESVIPLPYFPPVDSEDADGLVGPHVHEVCAQVMLKARAEMSQHGLRQLREKAVYEAIRLGGCRIDPLGSDRAQRLYYLFPEDPGRIYVCPPPLTPGQRMSEPSPKLAAASAVPPVDGSVLPEWSVYEDTEDMRRLVGWLHPEGRREGQLRRALTEAFPDLHAQGGREDQMEEAGEGKPPAEKEQIQSESPLAPKSRARAASESSDDFDDEEDEEDDGAGEGQPHDSDGEWNARRPHKKQRKVSRPSAARSSSRKSKSADPDEVRELAAAEEASFDPHGECSLQLVPMPTTTIPPEEAAVEFEDDDALEADMSEDGALQFNARQFYAVALVDSEGQRLRLPASLPHRVCFDILLGDGKIAHEELDQCWRSSDVADAPSDMLYFFCSIRFKKVGKFQLRFYLQPSEEASPEALQRIEALKVPPLVYTISVTATFSRTGAAAALAKLEGAQRLEQQRSSSGGRSRQGTAATATGVGFSLDVELNLPFEVDEFVALKQGLVAVASVLPSGALKEPEFGELHAAGPDGWQWTPLLSSSWVNYVGCAKTCQELAEALLLLEACINPKWLKPWYKQILNSFPATPYLLRLSTPSATALRLYLLDRALLYDKVQPRPIPEVQDVVIGRRRTRHAPSRYAEEEESEVERTVSRSGRQTRTSRAAYGLTGREAPRRSRSSRRNYNSYEEDSFMDEEEEEEASGSDDAARESGEGSALKPAARGRTQKRASTSGGEDEFEDGRSEGEDDEEEPAAPKPKRVAKKKSPRVEEEEEMYMDEEDEEAEDEEAADDDDDVYGEEDAAEDEQEEEEDGWSCNQCTMVNAWDNKRCEACRSFRPNMGDEETRRSSRRGGAPARPRRSTRRRSSRRGAWDDDSEEQNSFGGDSSEDSEGYSRRRKPTRSRPGTRAAATSSSSRPSRRVPPSVTAINVAEILNLDSEGEEEKLDLGQPVAERRQRIRRVIVECAKQPFAEPFLTPVDLMSFPMYRQYVSHPMDMGTICNKVRSGAYDGDSQSLLADVALIKENCISFNTQAHPISRSAALLEQRFVRLHAAWVSRVPPPAVEDLEDKFCTICGEKDEDEENLIRCMMCSAPFHSFCLPDGTPRRNFQCGECAKLYMGQGQDGEGNNEDELEEEEVEEEEEMEEEEEEEEEEEDEDEEEFSS
jgi:hypothetical protein